ncbi:uncharacterized protein LACBIDRAFT_236166 [Laccaria bicolor S238N-H82]|uniref:Predicted protein n=1 Tax=Laccaria bicolor (strain S238N-H82 / ATCC MYA-4686) TaxID=486041 RepID=B0DEB6_LACBS|nr:uncharacterized protein LACBIDRAFT_236166 [Laccaria bicolor S238N-H82]EDR07009.1 predicted protein [Laccaria bicolor S238N-H82]|eukprot:XP_001882382.1 predicted protein [Laccaria bicolor S238N-H82]
MAVHTRKIGNDVVSPIGFGLMALSAFYGATEKDEDRFKVLDAALEEGCTFWDTADVYGDSEELLGKWFKESGNREKIFLATKFGTVGTPERMINGEPEYVKVAVQGSLKKLRIDTIDLYYLHRADPIVPIEITVGAMAELVKEGKVKYLGLSEVSSETLRRAYAVHPIAAVQVEYSPFTLDIEDDKIALLKTCRELGVTVVAYSPLGRGMLTGRFKSIDELDDDDFRKAIPRYRDNFPNILKLVDGLREIGKKYGATAGQISLAWLLAQGDDIIPIPGTKGIKYLKENIAASKVNLSLEDVGEVRAIAKKADVFKGDRFPPGMMETLFVDTPKLS